MKSIAIPKCWKIHVAEKEGREGFPSGLETGVK
jgi:hypothetical protein